MSFRKRNVGITGSSGHDAASSTASEGDVRLKNVQKIVQYPGVRPSPLDGRPTTSTGTASLDGLLAGHSGLPLGNSVLIEETGTTDYAGTLLRYYAAEGVVQGHKVHVVGSGENWGRELPGVSGANESSDSSGAKGIGDSEKMKIAWRYERLGEFGAGPAASRGGTPLLQPLLYTLTSIASILVLYMLLRLADHPSLNCTKSSSNQVRDRRKDTCGTISVLPHV